MKIETFQEIQARIHSDILSYFPKLNSGVLYVLIQLGSVIAGVCYLLHRQIYYAYLQMSPFTCDEKHLPNWGRFYNVPRKLSAYSTGKVIIKSTKNNVVIPKGTVLQTELGLKFFTLTPVSTVNNKAIVSVISENSGADYNLLGETALSLNSPIEYILNNEIFFDEIGAIGAADEEDAETWRERILAFYRNPVRIGTKKDYEEWMLEIEGVTRAWCVPRYPLNVAGSVGLAYVCDNSVDIVPKNKDIMLSYITEIAPANAEIKMIDIVKVPITITISINSSTSLSSSEFTKDIKKYFEKHFRQMDLSEQIDKPNFISILISKFNLNYKDFSVKLEVLDTSLIPNQRTSLSGNEIATGGLLEIKESLVLTKDQLPVLSEIIF
ncbi:baseplate J/gp47 family protein [Silvanigrella sp.]|jgi:uncharacterized phage protein gp47/JayE|uniref:baseplate J/gp47 family protein n=1 Tax=Silvanigrella sp. TaxID=2024976 RepID=UPI0037C85910